MATYIIPTLNGANEIIDPILFWTKAGFSRDQTGEVVRIQITVQMTTPTFKGAVDFDVEGSADDRSNEAIDGLMLKLMDQYKLK